MGKISDNKLFKKLSLTLTDVKAHWSRPASGKYIPYKEMAAYSLAGFGYQLIGVLTGYLGLAATNTFIGFIIGIRPLHIQYMNIAMLVISALFTIMRGTMVDNTKTRWGRFRPYILFVGLPVTVLDIAFVFINFQGINNYMYSLAILAVVSVGHAFLSPLFVDSFNELRSVMSPDSRERTTLITVSSLVYSLAPTITQLIVPIFVYMFPNDYRNQDVYKYFLAPFAVLGLLMTLFAAFGTKERVVMSKQYRPKVRLLKGVLEIYKNKYLWIRNLHGWLGFLKGAAGVLFAWLFLYDIQNGTVWGLLQTVNGTAGGIAMAITPFVLRKLGNKKLMIFIDTVTFIMYCLFALVFKNYVLFFIANYVNLFVGNFYIIADPVMHCEVKDYQQYISGKRMDFMFGTAGLIALPITIATGLIIPAVYEGFGLTTNYEVLFDPSVRNSMFNILCWLSIFGSLIIVFPLFFYDLTETKHRNIIKILKLRALFEDKISGEGIQPEHIKEAVEQVNEAKKHAGLEKPDLKAERAEKLKIFKNIFSGKSGRFKERLKAYSAARKKYREAENNVDAIGAADMVLKELYKFETEVTRRKFSIWASRVF